jgi:hypothetical protein
MMEVVATPEASAKFCETTGRDISDGFRLHTCHGKNLKSRL